MFGEVDCREKKGVIELKTQNTKKEGKQHEKKIYIENYKLNKIIKRKEIKCAHTKKLMPLKLPLRFIHFTFYPRCNYHGNIFHFSFIEN